MTYQVFVRADYRWNTARVNGILFHKTDPVTLHDAELTDEIRASGILDVAEVADAPAPAVSAEPGAPLAETPPADDAETSKETPRRRPRRGGGG